MTNQYHVQNCIVICIFKLEDTITWDYLKWVLALLYIERKKPGFQFSLRLLAVEYVECMRSALLIVWPYWGMNQMCGKQPFQIPCILCCLASMHGYKWNNRVLGFSLGTVTRKVSHPKLPIKRWGFQFSDIPIIDWPLN